MHEMLLNLCINFRAACVCANNINCGPVCSARHREAVQQPPAQQNAENSFRHQLQSRRELEPLCQNTHALPLDSVCYFLPSSRFAERNWGSVVNNQSANSAAQLPQPIRPVFNPDLVQQARKPHPYQEAAAVVGHTVDVHYFNCGLVFGYFDIQFIQKAQIFDERNGQLFSCGVFLCTGLNFHFVHSVSYSSHSL